MGGPTDFIYVTPEEAVKKDLLNNGCSIDVFMELAKNNGLCGCGQQEWRLAGTGMCFPCTTGERDASDDHEVGDPY